MPVQFGVTEPKTAGFMEISFLGCLHYVAGLSTEHLWLDTWRAREPARRSAVGGDRETLLRQERLLLLLLCHYLDQILNLLKQLNPMRSELQKLLLLEVFELHELLQRM
jgi:hypothetical protein